MGRMWKRLAAAVLVLCLLAGTGILGLRHWQEHYVLLGGKVYPRDIPMLDLSDAHLANMERIPRFTDLKGLDLRRSDATPGQYEWLRENLPGCTILWDLPFQGEFYDRGTTQLTVRRLTMGDVELLDYLPMLTSVDGWDCPDYEALAALQQRRPDCKVFYNVEIDGRRYDCDTTDLELRDSRAPDLSRRLACLPRLRSVHFSGKLPELGRIRSLKESFPQVSFSWELMLEGELRHSDTRELDLSGGKYRDVVELDQLLHWFPALESLRLGQTDIPEDALLILERGYPGLQIWWDMDVLGLTVPRDAREVDLSGRPVPDVAALEARLQQMPKLEKVVMCDCGLSSEQMDQLDRRHPQIRFVWTVNLGGIRLRTDETWFCPNKYYIEVDDQALEELRYCYDMVCVDIGHMRGVTHCQWAANMPKLKYLVIADTSIKDLGPLAGLQELVFLEVFTSPVRDYTPLLECPNLQDLNLGYTYGDPTPVMQMNWLHRLWWPGSLRVLNWNVRNQLRTNLPDTKMNFVAGSSTGEGWRASPNYYAMRDYMGMPYMTG